MKKVYFKTFGCRTNQFDTQVMIKSLQNHQVTDEESSADVIVVNSCTVTNGADSSVRNYVAKHQDKKILFTGCGAITKGEELLNQERVNVVFGHSEKRQIEHFLTQDNLIQIGDLNHIDDVIVSDFVGKSRAFIKIQEGCDFECSYCIIPSVRGGARSHNEAQIIEQVSTLARNGFGEFILTGTNVGSYGKDSGSSMAKLLKKLSQLTGVRRIRIGSLEPQQIDEEFMELLDESWMAKHLHIALQHSSNTMLEIMRRRNRYESDLALFEKIAEHGYALGTDYIVGHSGESDVVWSEAIKNLKRLPLTHIHPFSYSKRDNTHSASFNDHIAGNIAKERLKELKAIVTDKNLAFREKLTGELNVLVESFHDNSYVGYDQYFNQVKISSNEDIRSNWVKLNEYSIEGDNTFATLVF
jgi:MiaB-like tRNA modifying enzyme